MPSTEKKLAKESLCHKKNKTKGCVFIQTKNILLLIVFSWNAQD